MASSEKVYVCGRCEDFGAPTLEELVVHMTNCGYPELRKKEDEPDQSEMTIEVEESTVYDDNDDNSESIDGAEHIIPEKKEHNERLLENSLIASSLSGFSSHSLEAGRSTSPTPFIWSKKTALILLKLLKDHRADMESPYIRRKTVWQKISAEMLELHGYSVSPSQCENKFKNMSNRYKKARDANLRADGRMKQTCFLYNELDEYYRHDPKFNAKQQESRLDYRFEPRYESRFKHKVVRAAPRYVEADYISREPIITLSEGENSQYLNNSSDGEPEWARRIVDSIEKWHAESIMMQREFIDVLKQLIDKK